MIVSLFLLKNVTRWGYTPVMYLSFSCFPSHSLLCRHTTIPAQHCRLSSGFKQPVKHWEGGIPSGQAVSHWHLLKDAITKKRTAEVAKDMFHFHLRQHRHLKSSNLSSLPPYTPRDREAESPSLPGVLKVLVKLHVRRRLVFLLGFLPRHESQHDKFLT